MKINLMKNRSFLIPGLALFLLSFFFTGCSKDSYNSDGGSGGINSKTIYMKNSVFSNTNLTVTIGGTVVWVNDDNMVHTVTANDGSFNSGDIQVNSSFSKTFNATGAYPYHCTYHSNMTGTIVVVAN